MSAFFVAPGVAAASTVTPLTADQEAGIAAGEEAVALSVGQPGLYDAADHTFNWAAAQSDGYIPDLSNTGASDAVSVYNFFEALGLDDPFDGQLGTEEYAALAQDGVVADPAVSAALADGSSDWWSGAIPAGLDSAALDLSAAAAGAVTLGGSSVLSLLITPDAAGALQTEQANSVADGSATGFQLVSNVQADGSEDGCVKDDGSSAASWASDCAGLLVNGGDDPTLIPAPGGGAWSVVRWTTPNTSTGSVMDWPMATGQGEVCAAPTFAVGAPFELGVGAPGATCQDANTAASDQATLEAAYLPGNDLQVGPLQLASPASGTPQSVAGTVTVPSYSDLLARVTAEYGDSVPTDDFGQGLVSAVNGGTEVDGTCSGTACRVASAEGGTTVGLARACDGVTAAACASLLGKAGYRASVAADTATPCTTDASSTDEAQAAFGLCGNMVGIPPTSWHYEGFYNGFDPVGTAEAIALTGNVVGPNGSASASLFDAVSVNATAGTYTIPASDTLTVLGEPDDVVPQCDGNGSLAGGAQGDPAGFETVAQRYYPMQLSACESALAADGYTNVVPEPLSGDLWDNWWGCSYGDTSCEDVGDAAGTVEWVEACDPLGASVPNYPSIDGCEAGGHLQPDKTQPVVVYYEAPPGTAVVGAPQVDPTSTDTTTTQQTDTTTGTTTTTTPTETSPNDLTTTAVTKVTTTSTVDTTGQTTSQTTTVQQQGTVTNTVSQSSTTSTSSSTDTTGQPTTTTSTTTTTESTNCVVSDTCEPPNPFNDPGPGTIHFPQIATPCNVFPFGVPCYVATQIEALNATPVAPTLTVALPTGPHSYPVRRVVNLGTVGGVDWNAIFGVARWFFLFFTAIGIVMWLTRRHGNTPAAVGGAPAESDEDGL